MTLLTVSEKYKVKVEASMSKSNASTTGGMVSVKYFCTGIGSSMVISVK